MTSFYDRFDLLECLGGGAQGEVYLVKEKNTGDQYAAKILPFPNVSNWEEADPILSKLKDEFQALQKIDNPHIPKVYELTEDDNPLYNRVELQLLMEYVPGETLDQRLGKKGRFSEEEIVIIEKQLLEALGAAHEKGIVHRDVKPSNIKITEDGQIKLLDFGTSKFLENKTRTASLGKGTLAYMAPEQLSGGKISEATDLYAVGLVSLDLARGKARESDINYADPLEDVVGLRGRYSDRFLDSLEIKLDQDPSGRNRSVVSTLPTTVSQRPNTVYTGLKAFGLTALTSAILGCFGVFLLGSAIPIVREHYLISNFILGSSLSLVFEPFYTKLLKNRNLPTTYQAPALPPPTIDTEIVETKKDRVNEELVEVLKRPSPTPIIDTPKKIITSLSPKIEDVEYIGPGVSKYTGKKSPF